MFQTDVVVGVVVVVVVVVGGAVEIDRVPLAVEGRARRRRGTGLPMECGTPWLEGSCLTVSVVDGRVRISVVLARRLLCFFNSASLAANFFLLATAAALEGLVLFGGVKPVDLGVGAAASTFKLRQERLLWARISVAIRFERILDGHGHD